MVKDFKNLDIVSITDFDAEDILHLCNKARQFFILEHGFENQFHKKNGISYRNALNHVMQGKKLASLFYEDSTRTSFRCDTAMKELGGYTKGFSGTEGTSVMKSESIRDTIVMMLANHFNMIVIRNGLDGAAQYASDVSPLSVINGGDGTNEHPTQALLDLFTLYMKNGFSLNNLEIGLGGDLAHGRTIRSLSLALSNFENITIRWAAEDFLGMPQDLVSKLRERNVKVIREEKVEYVIEKSFAYYMTRPQFERMKKLTINKIISMLGNYMTELGKTVKNFSEQMPKIQTFLNKLEDLAGKDPRQQATKLLERYVIDSEKINDSDTLLLHPLPVNSKVAEIDHLVFFSPNFIAYEQAENGIFMTKAILYEIQKNQGHIEFNPKLPEALKKGNNRIIRDLKPLDKQNLDVKIIKEGSCIDHLKVDAAKDLVDILNLKGEFYIACNSKNHQKSYFKSELTELTERQLKQIALISPEPTINIIVNGEVIEKYVYTLCENDNCITRAVNEDVKPLFYYDEGKECRYCRKPYRRKNPKITEKEKQGHFNDLPTKVEKIE